MGMSIRMSFKLGRFFLYHHQFYYWCLLSCLWCFRNYSSMVPFSAKDDFAIYCRKHPYAFAIWTWFLPYRYFNSGLDLCSIHAAPATPHIRTGAQAVILDENVVQQYLEGLLARAFSPFPCCL